MRENQNTTSAKPEKIQEQPEKIQKQVDAEVKSLEKTAKIELENPQKEGSGGTKDGVPISKWMNVDLYCQHLKIEDSAIAAAMKNALLTELPTPWSAQVNL